MRILVYRWPGPMGRRTGDNGFGWCHFHALPGVTVAWKRSR